MAFGRGKTLSQVPDHPTHTGISLSASNIRSFPEVYLATHTKIGHTRDNLLRGAGLFTRAATAGDGLVRLRFLLRYNC